MFELRTSGTLLAETIRREVELSEQLLREGFSHSVKAGELLAELKNLVPESKFEEWLSKKCKLSREEALRLVNFSSGSEIKLTVQRAQKPEKRKEQENTEMNTFDTVSDCFK